MLFEVNNQIKNPKPELPPKKRYMNQMLPSLDPHSSHNITEMPSKKCKKAFWNNSDTQVRGIRIHGSNADYAGRWSNL